MREYDASAREVAWVEEEFVDPVPPYDPADGPSDRWYRRVVEHMGEFVIAFRHDGTVTYVTESIEFLLGYDPVELLGTNALDIIDPADLGVAAETVYHSARVEGWRPPRPFRLRHANGTTSTFEVEGMALYHVEEVQSIVCVCRWAEEAARVDRTVSLLATQAPLADVLGELVHAMWRPGWKIGVALQYDDGEGGLAVAHTGLPDALLQFDRTDGTTPWGEALTTGQPVYDVGLAMVPAPVRSVAEGEGLHTCWAIPVSDPGFLDALLIAWNHELVVPELGQESLLDKLIGLIELAFAGRSRTVALERAASTDVLTGLANRRAFEVALGAARTRSAPTGISEADGSDVAPSTADEPDLGVLFLDLDAFKAVNDGLGHGAGDEVLREVGRRIRATVRPTDLPARVGGDEFAVLCRGVVDDATMAALADRLIAVVGEPIAVGEAWAEVGVSIGGVVAGASGVGNDHLLEMADRAMYAAKQAGKGTYVGFRAPAGTGETGQPDQANP